MALEHMKKIEFLWKSISDTKIARNKLVGMILIKKKKSDYIYWIRPHTELLKDMKINGNGSKQFKGPVRRHY